MNPNHDNSPSDFSNAETPHTVTPLTESSITPTDQPPNAISDSSHAPQTHDDDLPKQTFEQTSSRDKLPAGFILKERYKIDGILGSGGFGIVYAATDILNNERRVAIKTLRNAIDDYDVAAKRFQREIELCASINSEHVVKILDHGSTTGPSHGNDEMLYYVMERLEGKTLDEYLERREKFTFFDVQQIMLQVLDVLSIAHRKGIVHRDMKPSNINLLETPPDTHQFYVKVLDFGIAKIIEDDGQREEKLTRTGNWLGSPAYMSPEQLKGYDITPASDIFSIGLIMSEMLTGYCAIDGDSPMDIAMNILSSEPVEIEDWIADSPIGNIIKKCTQKLPSMRYPDASDLKNDLLALDENTLKNEYASAKLRKRSRPSTTQTVPSPDTLQVCGSPTTLSQPVPALPKGFTPLQILIFLGIILAILALALILFVKFYVDKSTSEAENEWQRQLPPPPPHFNDINPHIPLHVSNPIRSAVQGAALGTLNLARIDISISSMPPGATIYRADGSPIGQTPTSLKLIPARGETWPLIIKSKGYTDYPLTLNLTMPGNVALTLQKETDIHPVPQPAPTSENSPATHSPSTNATTTNKTKPSSKPSQNNPNKKNWRIDDIL